MEKQTKFYVKRSDDWLLAKINNSTKNGYWSRGGWSPLKRMARTFGSVEEAIEYCESKDHLIGGLFRKNQHFEKGDYGLEIIYFAGKQRVCCNIPGR